MNNSLGLGGAVEAEAHVLIPKKKYNELKRSHKILCEQREEVCRSRKRLTSRNPNDVNNIPRLLAPSHKDDDEERHLQHLDMRNDVQDESNESDKAKDFISGGGYNIDAGSGNLMKQLQHSALTLTQGNRLAENDVSTSGAIADAYGEQPVPLADLNKVGAQIRNSPLGTMTGTTADSNEILRPSSGIATQGHIVTSTINTSNKKPWWFIGKIAN